MTVPALGSTTLMEIWEQSDQDSERLLKKVLREGLDQELNEDSSVVPRFKTGKPTANPKLKWMEEKAYPHKCTAQLSGTGTTLTISGYLERAAVNELSILRIVRVGTVFMRPTDGQQYICTAKTGVTDGSSPWAITVTEHGYTASGSPTDDSGPVEWWILGEPWTDATTADETRSVDRFFRFCGTQIFAEPFEIFETRKNTAYEMVASELEHQIGLLITKMNESFGYWALNGVPVWDTNSSKYVYGDETERPMMTGLWGWAKLVQAEYSSPTIFVNKDSAVLTKDDINDLVRNMMLEEHAKFKRGSWCICCHPNVNKYIAEFDSVQRVSSQQTKGAGYYVNKIMTDIGVEFEVVPDQYLRPGVLHVVDTSAFEHGHYVNDDIHRKSIPTFSRTERWLVSLQRYGLVARRPRQVLGTIYGIAT